MTHTSDILYDVAVVGCGPVGAVAANLLGRAGHRVLVLEKGVDTYPLPRAVHLDHEMMRLFQGLKLIDDILPIMRETQGHLHLGADGDVIRYMGSVGKPKRFGWANDYFFYQPELEAVLRRGFGRYNSVDFVQGAEVTGIDELSAHVEISTEAQTYQARYVIGCDGARSGVRKALGITLDDLNFEEAWLVVDANVEGPISFPPIPSLPEGADVQQLSVMTCDPRRPATIVPGRGAHRRWEFMLLPDEIEAQMSTPEAVTALIEPWLQGCTYELVRAATYKFHGLVAHQWQKGRVFLAGDAAHQTPPFFGQGMCHGLRDVSNLAFKLDWVLRGRADAGLLETYQFERDPHVRHVIGAAVAAGHYICELDAQKAAIRDEEIRVKQRQGGDIATAADLIPPYRSGLVTSGAGERFIQPRVSLPDGKSALLDDLTGGGLVLISQLADPLMLVSLEGRQLADELGLKVLTLSEGAFGPHSDDLNRYFADHHATTVVLRPDSYVFGRAKTHEDVAKLFGLLRAKLVAVSNIHPLSAQVSHVRA